MNTYHVPDESLNPAEGKEVKEANSKMIADCTAQFLAQGGEVKEIPTGVSGIKETDTMPRLEFGDGYLFYKSKKR